WIVGLAEAERDALLSGPALAASAVLGAPGAGGDRGEGDPAFVVRHALFWVGSRLASETPLVVVVDDAQWGDGASLRWLAHGARRIGDTPVLLVLAFRVGERSVDVEAVAQLRSVAGGSLLRPASLSASAVLGLARRTLGSVGDAFAEACHARTAGDPLFVHELLRAVLDEDVAAGEDPALVLERIGSRHAVDRAVRRLEGVSETGRRVAFAVAVLGAAQVYEAAALAGVAPEAAEAAGDEL